ncbi:MAG: DUF624 domain-containing protein [Eubacteriales bacterium]|nr:DUF624 domain-containing protein [Eubacteriales bacterium]
MRVFTAFFAEENEPANGVLQFVKRFWGSLWDIIKLNLLFLLCCLPVVTAGAALAGLTEASYRLASDDGRGIWHDFFQGASRHWKAFTLYLMLELPLGALLLFSILQYGRWLAHPAAAVAGALCIGLGLFCFAAACYLHSVRISDGLPLKKALKNAVCLVLLGLPDFGFLGGVLILWWLGIAMLPYSLPAFVLFLPAAAAFTSSFASLRTAARYPAG